MNDQIINNRFEILIVDDVKDNLLALRSLLSREDIQVFQATSGNEALELMMKHDFGLALLDIQMPGMNGFELAELMRGTNKTKHIPIIFVTALAKDEKYTFRGYESGAVDFLRKPLDPHAVKSKVNVFLEIHQQRKELEFQVKELELTRAELELAVQVREEFMAIAGHELKTPLTSLKLHTQLRKRTLAKGDLASFTSEKLFQMFESDNVQLERLTRLIDDMLDVSRMSSGKLSMDKEDFDICALVNTIIERNSKQYELGGHQVNLTTCLSAIGSWDKGRIEQVISNLLSNAMRYGDGKPIDVNITTKGHNVSVVIRDHGVGISSEDINRIFQRYERATVTEVSGLGLGLYIVSQIIEAHQGTISVESKLGEGSEFTILLPYLKTLQNPLNELQVT